MHHLTREATASSERPTDARSISSSALHYSASTNTSGFAPGSHARPRLVQWYVVVVLQALMHCGLLQTLEAAGRSPARQLAARAGELLREVPGRNRP